jgi:hypothetical protein
MAPTNAGGVWQRCQCSRLPPGVPKESPEEGPQRGAARGRDTHSRFDTRPYRNVSRGVQEIGLIGEGVNVGDADDGGG